MKIKAGKQFIDLVKLAYRANKCLLVESGHGIGKSSMMLQAASELNVQYKCIDSTLIENVDVCGIPRIVGNRTEYATSCLLPTSGAGILCIEEIGRADRTVQASLLCLLTSRKIHDTYTLPPKWVCMATTNPCNGEYDIASPIDAALKSRFINCELLPDVRSWIAFAEKSKIHPAVIRYIRSTPDVFSSESNPRAWHYVSDVLHSYEQGGGNQEEILLTAIAGLVGDTHGVAFLQGMLQGEDPIPAEAILSEDYGKCRSTIQRWVKAKQMDILNSTVHGVLVALQDADTLSRVTKLETIRKSLEEFASDVPSDLGKKIRKALK